MRCEGERFFSSRDSALLFSFAEGELCASLSAKKAKTSPNLSCAEELGAQTAFGEKAAAVISVIKLPKRLKN